MFRAVVAAFGVALFVGLLASTGVLVVPTDIPRSGTFSNSLRRCAAELEDPTEPARGGLSRRRGEHRQERLRLRPVPRRGGDHVQHHAVT